MQKRDVIISMSGGLDSTMLAMYMLSKGCSLKIYSFKYGQKHEVELCKLNQNIEFLKSRFPDNIISYQEIDITAVFNESESSLSIYSGDDIPEGNYDDANMISTVVENRNVIFASIIYAKALSWSKKTSAPVYITLGTHAGDHTIYPDCTPQSLRAVQRAFKVSNWGSENIKYIAPFNKIDKGALLAKGIDAMRGLLMSDSDIEFILSNTHTCYNPTADGLSCGVCGSCNERLLAFAANGIKDPLSYSIKI